MVRKELENVLAEQLLELKVNEISPYLDDSFQSCHYGTEIYVEEKR